MENIAIFGAGGFGREVASTVERINKKKPTWNLIGFFDDGIEEGSLVSHFGRILGGVNELNNWATDLSIAIAVGNPNTMRRIRERINNPHISFPNIIFEPFGLADAETFKIGEGNIIQGGCWASCNVTIGNFNILNGSVVLGHDVKVGDFNSIMPGVRVSGDVTIGDENLIGVGSIILQRLIIGNKVHIGAGAILMTKPKDGGTYIGNPAKLFKY